ncbi:ABC-F family ATP-binding cassette domain-containing protein [Aminipila butyrica]|uniref:ABC-F family ATP-binding cassette domain-containing protein n=1 Tax=Aminipila butyrica TaxID=433296 RepID=A0A858BTY1_9FIRM|nr:ABC-F family ATP-binding cassette domain-containing protein [Aminipila butyrica]QIB68545.1 ABC-F family ATP-binding cassette domain-containing protein [Aminipila butyrica]
MSLLDITELSHSFGDHLLYKNAKLSLNKGEHMGIVGQNGTGKSTLIKICTEQLMPDSGRVFWQANLSVGYLDQYAQINGQLTGNAFLKTAFSTLYQLEADMLQLYQQAALGESHCLDLAAQYQETLDREDFYSIDTRLNQVAEGLGLLAIGLNRPIGELSGGQRTKIILAKLLLAKPDVLLLDEPTNFLDKEHISWLANYLANLENAFMVVSHDHSFLERITNRICDVDGHTLTKYYGTYSAFLIKKSLLQEDYLRQYTAQQREIKKTEEFIRKNIAGRKSRMARGRRKQLERLEKIEALDQTEIKPVFSFQACPLTNAQHLSVGNLSVGYAYPLLSSVNLEVKGGQKVVITGFNGIGKSTLLKTLVGLLPPLGGQFHFSSQVSLEYFEQEMTWPEKNKNPMQLLSHCFPALSSKEVHQHLARCGISSRHALQAIGTLSGGEQAKVKLCLLTLKPYNFLILDEPTNHLDKQAKEALKAALAAFPGTVLLVCHEEDFYRDWAQYVLDMAQGANKSY